MKVETTPPTPEELIATALDQLRHEMQAKLNEALK